MEIKSKNLSSFHKRENSIQEQNPKRKAFEELSLMDAFLFDVATEKDENAITIAKTIIERVTGRKVNNLTVQTQKELKGINIDKHGIRMDVYTTEVNNIEDTEKTTCVYDIEPNNYEDDDIARRNRYYQSLINCKLLPPDTPYSTLPDMFSIWILSKDPFDDDRMIYTVKNMVAENNQIVYNDGVTNIFLYTRGTSGGSRKLKELLTFMENPICDNAVDEELLKILDIVDTVKGNSKERGRYMGLMGYTDYIIRDGINAGLEEAREGAHAEGLAEGLAEGRAEGLIEGAIKNCKFIKVSRKTAKEAIIMQFSLTAKQAEEYMKLYW